jgi:hypothetical protein
VGGIFAAQTKRADSQQRLPKAPFGWSHARSSERRSYRGRIPYQLERRRAIVFCDHADTDVTRRRGYGNCACLRELVHPIIEALVGSDCVGCNGRE